MSPRTIAHGEEETLTGSALRSYLSGFTSLVEDLERTMNSLPHVDSSGYSPCPPEIVDQLYDKKEKLEAQVSAHMPGLYRALAALEKEVDQCKQKLDRIRGDRGRIHRKETKDKYSEAEKAQELKLRRAKDARDAAYLAIKKAEAALKVSKGRRMPKTNNKNDKASTNAKDHKSSSKSGSGSREGGKKSGDSVQGLLSTGPRRQSQKGKTKRS
jgi:hypothetical protein